MSSRTRFEREAGQALVEFALITPIVMLILLAILSYGLLLSWLGMLNTAAREAARSAAVSEGESFPGSVSELREG